jgi:hypothetical protein
VIGVELIPYLHYDNFPIYPCDPSTRDRSLAMARRRCRLRLMAEWSKDHVAAIGSLKTQHFGLWLKFG